MFSVADRTVLQVHYMRDRDRGVIWVRQSVHLCGVLIVLLLLCCVVAGGDDHPAASAGDLCVSLGDSEQRIGLRGVDLSTALAPLPCGVHRCETRASHPLRIPLWCVACCVVLCCLFLPVMHMCACSRAGGDGLFMVLNEKRQFFPESFAAAQLSMLSAGRVVLLCRAG